ncbi:hypothetical protein COAQ111491_21980 [Comamonas aquatilis]
MTRLKSGITDFTRNGSNGGAEIADLAAKRFAEFRGGGRIQWDLAIEILADRALAKPYLVAKCVLAGLQPLSAPISLPTLEQLFQARSVCFLLWSQWECWHRQTRVLVGLINSKQSDC